MGALIHIGITSRLCQGDVLMLPGRKSSSLGVSILSLCWCSTGVAVPMQRTASIDVWSSLFVEPQSHVLTWHVHVDVCSSEAPEVFGMHSNANITFQLQEARQLLDTVLSIQPRVSGSSGADGSGAGSADALVAGLCAETLQQLPADLHPSEACAGLFDRMSDGKLNSLSVVLSQEVDRFRRLAGVLRTSLVQLQAAIRGLVVMSAELEAAYNALLLNQVGVSCTGFDLGVGLPPGVISGGTVLQMPCHAIVVPWRPMISAASLLSEVCANLCCMLAGLPARSSRCMHIAYQWWFEPCAVYVGS
jgi:hypothetical protein